MREIIDRCNVCKRVRGEGNHWVLMRERHGDSPTFLSWDDEEAGHLGCVCSASCAHTALDAWLTAQQALRRVSPVVPEPPAVSAFQYPEANLPDPAPVVDTVEQFETLESPQEADQFQDIPF